MQKKNKIVNLIGAIILERIVSRVVGSANALSWHSLQTGRFVKTHGGVSMATEMTDPLSPQALAFEPEPLAYSIHEAADLLGVDYFSVYRLIQRGKFVPVARFGESCSCRARNCCDF